MPFTPAHTIAVLPFVKFRRLCGSALIAGSMSPDFEYFIRMNSKGIWGHDIPGIFLFDLPMTFALVVLFHLVVKKRLIDNLPGFFQKRLSHLKDISVSQDILERPVMFAVCACVGAATHVAWDEFTHNGGYFVEALPGIYEGAYVRHRNVYYPLWYVLQHISTFVGLTILGIYILLLKPAVTAVKSPKIGYWAALLLIAALSVLIRRQFPSEPGIGVLVISSITGLCAGMIILGLLPSSQDTAY